MHSGSCRTSTYDFLGAHWRPLSWPLLARWTLCEVLAIFGQGLKCILLRPMHKRLKMPMPELNGLLMSVEFSTTTNGKFSPDVETCRAQKLRPMRLTRRNDTHGAIHRVWGQRRFGHSTREQALVRPSSALSVLDFDADAIGCSRWRTHLMNAASADDHR